MGKFNFREWIKTFARCEVSGMGGPGGIPSGQSRGLGSDPPAHRPGSLGSGASPAGGGPWPPRCRREASLEPQPRSPLPRRGSVSTSLSCLTLGRSQRPCGCCLTRGSFLHPWQTREVGTGAEEKPEGSLTWGAPAPMHPSPSGACLLCCALTAPPASPPFGTGLSSHLSCAFHGPACSVPRSLLLDLLLQISA